MKIYAFSDEASPDLEGQIGALKRHSLCGPELRNISGVSISDADSGLVLNIKKTLAYNGLDVYSIGSPIGKISIEEDFAPHLDRLKRTLDTASTLSAGHIRVFSFYIPKDTHPSRFRNEVIYRMSVMAETAREYGIELCHENEKGIYGDSPSRCLDLLGNVPGLKAVFDPANFVQCGHDTLSAWSSLSGHVRYMHIKDALPDGTVVPCGKGVGNLEKIIADFAAHGGEVLTLEPHLRVFKGLEKLEKAGDRSGVSGGYADSGEAFAAAVANLNETIERIGLK